MINMIAKPHANPAFNKQRNEYICQLQLINYTLNSQYVYSYENALKLQGNNDKNVRYY